MSCAQFCPTLVISAPAPQLSHTAGMALPPTDGTPTDGIQADDIQVDWLGATAIAFLDPAVPDWPVLMAGLRPGVAAIALEPDRDGMAQISAWLAWRSQASVIPLREIHLFCHGVPGALLLGDRILNRDTLPRYRWQLRQWFDGHEGSLLLYGCQVALGDRGLAFVQQLHALTGATVAASARRTGCATLGGDWGLEVRLGDGAIASAVLPEVQATYRGVLATYTVTSTEDTEHPEAGKETLRSAIVKANQNPDQDHTIKFAEALFDEALLQGDLPVEIKAPQTLTGFYIRGNLTIEGPGRDKLHLVRPEGDNSQQKTTVFTISDQPSLDTIWTENNWRLGPRDSKFLPFIIPVPNRQVNISGLTVKGGNLFGGIFSTENLTLTDVGVVENTINADSSLKIKVGYPEQQLYFSPGVTAINGELRIRDSYIAENSGENTRGGGVAAYTVGRNLSAVPIQKTVIDQTDAGEGGQVFTGKQNVIIENSTIAGNTVTAKTDTGAIVDAAGVSDPQKVVTGGGIWSEADNTLIRNSTIANNTATFGGGGIAGAGQRTGEGFGNLFVYNSTVTGNEAQHSQGRGGGIFGEALVQNSIVAGNAAATDADGVATGRLPEAAPDVAGGFLAVDIGEPEPLLLPGGIDLGVKSDDRAGDGDKEGFNLIGNLGQLSPYDVKGNGLYPVVRSDGELLMIAIPQSEFLSNAFFGAADGDSVGTADQPLALETIVGEVPADGNLLRDNGGLTPTVKLGGDGWAIDGGNPTFEPPPKVDQLGRDRVVGGRVDVGPYEFVPTQFVVNTDQDVVDPNDGVVSLREAIDAANANPGPDKIIFDTGTTSSLGANKANTIILKYGALQITDDLILEGLPNSKVIIDGNQDQGFLIDDGQRDSHKHVEITNFEVTNSSGGAIENHEILNLSQSSIYENIGYTLPISSNIPDIKPPMLGGVSGGISNYGQLRLFKTKISDNASELYGGGIYNNSGIVTMVASEVSNNQLNKFQKSYGGGIYSAGLLGIFDSEIIDNKANPSSGQGGGLYVGQGQVAIEDSLISRNQTGNYIDSFPENDGGGIFVEKGDIYISRSLILKNQSSGNGGGIVVSPNADSSNQSEHINRLIVENSVIAENAALLDAGGIESNSQLNLYHNLIYGNQSNEIGGGLLINGNREILENSILEKSIIANNTARIYDPDIAILSDPSQLDPAKIVDSNSKDNLIGFLDAYYGTQIKLGTGDKRELMGQDPKVKVATNARNGRPVYTLESDSAAINASSVPIDNTFPTIADLYDQRGASRLTDGAFVGGKPDIGPFEYGAEFNNSLPIALDDIASGDIDATFPFSSRRLGAERLFVDNVLTNDYDRDGDTLAVCSVNGSADNIGQPVGSLNGGLGLLTVQADGSFIFDPNGDFAFLYGIRLQNNVIN